MLTPAQTDFIEHLLATAEKLPPRYPLMSAGEFLRRMQVAPGIRKVLPAATELPSPLPTQAESVPACEQPLGQASMPIPMATVYERGAKQRESQLRRWAAHNAAVEDRVREFLANSGPQKIVELALGAEVSIPRMYQLVTKLKLRKLSDGRYEFPAELERQAS